MDIVIASRKPADYITKYKMIRHSYMNNINNIVEVTLRNKQFITDDCFITVGCFLRYTINICVL